MVVRIFDLHTVSFGIKGFTSEIRYLMEINILGILNVVFFIDLVGGGTLGVYSRHLVKVEV